MSHTKVHRGLVAGLGGVAAALAVAGLAATAPAAHADDIDTYGGANDTYLDFYLGNSFYDIELHTPFNVEVNDTTGAVTPDFALPELTIHSGTFTPGLQEFGVDAFSYFYQYLGDISNTLYGELFGRIRDYFGQVSYDFYPLPFFEDYGSIAKDLDIFPF